MNLDAKEYSNLDVPSSGEISQDEKSTNYMTGNSVNSEQKGKKRKRGSRAEYKTRISNRGFKLIDKRFKQQITLLPGIITQSKPIAGVVEVNITLQAEVFQKAIKMVLDRWSLGVGFSELRSLKGLNGLPSSTSDDECLNYTAQILTICLISITNLLYREDNFGVYLQNLGMGKLILPSIFVDVINMIVSYKRLHNPEFLECSSLMFTIKDLVIKTQPSEIIKKTYSRAFEKFGQYNTPFYTVYNYLSRFSQLTSIMSTSVTDCYELSTGSSPFIFNVITDLNEDEDFMLKVGNNITEKDVLLALIFNVSVSNTDLSEYHLDYYHYLVPKSQWLVGLKRAILDGYCSIEDRFISPTTTALAGDIAKSEVSSITNV